MADDTIAELFGRIDGFQWHAAKSVANLAKHGIDFNDASMVFYEPHVVLKSSYSLEQRWIAIGEFETRVIAVIFTYRNNEIRIISARRARENEERAYRHKTMGGSPERQD